MWRWLLVCALVSGVFVSASVSSGADADQLPPASEEPADFARDVQPLLRERCYSCHGPESQEGGLRLDVKDRGLEGGDSAEDEAVRNDLTPADLVAVEDGKEGPRYRGAGHQRDEQVGSQTRQPQDQQHADQHQGNASQAL